MFSMICRNIRYGICQFLELGTQFLLRCGDLLVRCPKFVLGPAPFGDVNKRRNAVLRAWIIPTFTITVWIAPVESTIRDSYTFGTPAGSFLRVK
jgi:hypothetical protein